MRAVDVGFDVVGLETDVARVGALNQGRSYVDDVTSEELTRALNSGRYLASSDVSACEGFDIAVISVPTPLRDGLPDLDFVRRAASMLARYVSAGSIVVLESTTYPGTTEEVVA